jgi:ComF family protein
MQKELRSPRTDLRNIIDPLLSVLLAPVCAACDHPLDHPTRGPVCEACWQAITPFTPPLCEVCGDPRPSWRTSGVECNTCPRCRDRHHLVSHGRAIGEYDGPLRSIIHALKYNGHRSLARSLARLMIVSGARVLQEADLAVPVPLHRARKRARGFNQAAEIAKHLTIPAVDALKRTRATASQTDLPAQARHANVRNAFALRRHVDINGRVIVLVDDVSTTGATLEACARVLLDAGAREVRALTAARVVSQPR